MPNYILNKNKPIRLLTVMFRGLGIFGDVLGHKLFIKKKNNCQKVCCHAAPVISFNHIYIYMYIYIYYICIYLYIHSHYLIAAIKPEAISTRG